MGISDHTDHHQLMKCRRELAKVKAERDKLAAQADKLSATLSAKIAEKICPNCNINPCQCERRREAADV